MKMRNKIFLLCVSCTLGALLIQTVLFQKKSSELIYEQAKEESFHSLQNMQNEVYTFVKSVESNLVDIYNQKQFMQDLRSDAPIEELKGNYYRLAYHLATEKFDTSDGVVACYLYNSEDEVISVYRRAVTPKHNYPQDLYEDAKASGADRIREYVASDNTTMLISSYYNVYRETGIVHFVLKIYDNNNLGRKIGYVVCDIDSKVLKSIMEKYSMQDEMFMWLQPLGHDAIVSIGELEENSGKYFDSAREQIKNGAGVDSTSLIEGKRVLFSVAQNKYNLSAYSLMPQSLLEENQRALTRTLLIIAAGMAVLILGLSFVTASGLTKPLDKLMYTIERIKGGETTIRSEDNKNDEIGRLGENFNEMLDRIEDLISHEYETKLLLNRAEYKALQAQINPHFLYNTLETISSIASVQNCSIVSNLCQSLSNLFRYSLDMKNPFSTVAKEIVHLKNYIYVMNVRMGDNIAYRFDIAPQVLQDSVPRISIQPLVENALNHGLRNKRGEKKIQIEAKEEKGSLLIAVRDNGVGMDADEINRRLRENNLDYVEQGSSIGLYNINARMKMLYGQEYGLQVRSVIGEGTEVLLMIPGKKMEEMR